MGFLAMGGRRPLPSIMSGGYPDLDGFHSSPLSEPFSPSLDCGGLPVNALVGLLSMNCNTVLGVSSFSLSAHNQSACLPQLLLFCQVGHGGIEQKCPDKWTSD